MRTCNKCKEEKDLDQFYKETKPCGWTGHRSECKACQLVYKRANKLKKKEAKNAAASR